MRFGMSSHKLLFITKKLKLSNYTVTGGYANVIYLFCNDVKIFKKKKTELALRVVL